MSGNGKLCSRVYVWISCRPEVVQVLTFNYVEIGVPGKSKITVIREFDYTTELNISSFCE